MAKLRFLKEYRWELAGLFLLFFCVYINLFPKDYIILGGDILQPIKMVNNFSFYYYEWSGRVSLFYGLFYLLDKVGVSDTVQISWYLGIFLIGSYLSFLTFCSLVFPASSRHIRSLVSLFYATNLYTLYVFTATWGYTSYQIIYLFIPLLAGLFIRSLESKRGIYSNLFLLVAFLTSTSFGNPTFALSSGIFFFFLGIFLMVFRFINLEKRDILRLVTMVVGAILLNVYWMLPLFPQVKSGIQEIYSSEEVNLTERLQKTSNSIFDTVRLLQTSEQDRYYPVNFPYPNFQWMESYIVVLTFLPILLVFAGAFLKKPEREEKLYGVFSALLVVFIILVARVRFPFEPINTFLFNLPGMNALRSYDKLATFVPFIVSVLVLMSLQSRFFYKRNKVVSILFFVLVILLALPFYAGGLQTKLSYILSNQKHKDFREASYSALVKVPDSYNEILPLLESDKEMNKISMLPFSEGSSIGRVNLPDWKVNGPHIARALYPKPYVELTESYIPGWRYADDFEKTGYNPKWITDFFGLIGVKYILYHKDAKPASLEKFEGHRAYLEEIGALEKVRDTPFITLYQISGKELFPYIYTTTAKDLWIDKTPKGLSEKTEELHSAISRVDFEKKNIKDFSAHIGVAADGGHIILNERRDNLWKAKLILKTGGYRELERDDQVRYANAWRLDGIEEGDTIRIYYSTLNLFFLGKIISSLTLLLVCYGLWKRR